MNHNIYKFQFDDKQLLIIEKLNSIIKKINTRNIFNIFNIYRNTNFGIYLYGPIGNGKTTISKYFFKKIKTNKKIFFHYQDFITLIHQELYTLQKEKQSQTNKIQEIAMKYSKKFSLICIDEFEINDIADATIIMPLILDLINKQTFLFITSNTSLKDFSQKINMQKFLLSITNAISNKINILYFNNQIDYRIKNFSLPQEKKIIYPINNKNIEYIENIISKTLQSKKLKIKDIDLFGRKIILQQTTEDTLITNSQELFEQNLGYSDYNIICKNFNTIIVKNVYIISNDNSNLATRFINFIDNAYFLKIKLFILLETKPEKIYSKGRKSEDFKRTLSRLNEMNSNDYEKKIYK